MRNAKTGMTTISLTGAFITMLLIVAPTSASADETATLPGDFTRGVKLWSDNCARCHNMRDPKEFRDDQWKVITTHMRLRGGLTGQETRDIIKFLQDSN